jgi:ribosomal protein S18 acetylase RimI-like enzyme
LSRAWRGSGPCTLWHIGDVSWWERRDWGKDALVWEGEGGEVVGFEDSDRYGYYELALPPEWVGRAAHAQIVVETEARPRQPLPPERGQAGFRTYAAEDNSALIQFLEGRGYSRSDYYKVQMLQPLTSTGAPQVVPEGFQIRSLAGEEDIPARLAVHQAVFGGVLEVDRYRRLMRLPTYRRDLDLVAVAPDGKFLANCLFWMDEPNALGQIEPVGTHPDYRRRGLARALVVEGLRRLRVLGATTAYVRPEDPNPDLIGFYESCGFRTSRRDYIYYRAG